VLKRLCTFALCLVLASSAHADDGLAKQRFDEGVAAAAEGHWQEAAEKLEASLADRDRPATRFNLILAYHELRRPLELVRHAIVFLALSPDEAREAARRRTEALMTEAKQQLAVVELSGAPPEAVVRVDGAPVQVADGPSSYVLPGDHVIEVQVGAASPRTTDLTLHAGQVVSWAELERQVAVREMPSSPPPIAASPPPGIGPTQPVPDAVLSVRLLRKRSAWAMGVVGAAAAIAAGGCMWAAVERGHDLSDGGIEGMEEFGYRTSARRYSNTLGAVMGLAFSSGALMAAAIPVGGEIVQRGSLAWSIVALSVGAGLLGAGTYWLIREPKLLIDTVDDLVRPSRQAGSLLIAAGLPPTTYGIAFLVKRRQRVQLTLHGVFRLRVVW
jgi:hypothetical protein